MPRGAWLAGAIVLAVSAFFAWPGGDGPGDGSDQASVASVTENLELPPAQARADEPPTENNVGGATAAAPGDRRDRAETASPAPRPEPERDWATVEVRPGDTLAALLSRHGLGPSTVHHVVYLNEQTARLRDLKPGEEIQLDLDDDGKLAALRFELNEAELVEVTAAGDSFESSIIQRPIETRVVRASGVIRDSLYMAAQNAGLSDPLIMKLAHIFAWDIDFVYDIRGGDRFYLIYEEVYRDGEKLRDGNVLAATFVNRGDALTAVRYDTGEGMAEYYTPEQHAQGVPAHAGGLPPHQFALQSQSPAPVAGIPPPAPGRGLRSRHRDPHHRHRQWPG